MCVEEDNNRGLMLHAVANVGEILPQAHDSDVESWYEDLYSSVAHREIMLADCSWEHTYNPPSVNGVAQGESQAEGGTGVAACAVCHYGGYYYVRVQFYAG